MILLVRPARSLLVVLLLGTLLAASAPPARAGGGPETTLIVVNADSPASWQVANAYARLRRIPATHLCPIPAVSNLLVIDIDEFRERILAPIEAWIAEHGLEDEIDTIAYSADFPFGVNYAKDFDVASLPQLAKPPVASLTGMTYLHRLVKAKSRLYLDLSANQYLRLNAGGELMPGHGFRHAYGWGRKPQPENPAEDPNSPDRYYLSTMLGFTGMQGNTVPEVLECLKRAAASDGTHPKGHVYFMINPDVRSRTRQPQFPKACEALEKLGCNGICLEAGQDGQDGKLPLAKDDVIGLVAGSAGFDWPAAKSTMLPGAIAEHLTSFGAKFDGSGQTKISEFIRGGAAGSAGAVAEPYALWQKFPLCSLHVHYGEGCSLAESFYQAVAGPYQLLVIGDPLARPYATFADIALESPPAKGAWSAQVPVLAKVTPPAGKAVRVVEVWLDGQRLGESAPGAPFELDTTKAADGEHELRLVAVEDSRIETRSSWIGDITIRNGSASATIKGPRGTAAWGETVKLSGKVSGAKEVQLVSGYRVLAEAKVSGSTWKAEFDTRLVGEGATRVQARATLKDDTQVFSPFLDVEVGGAGGAAKPSKAKRPRKGKTEAKPAGKPGLEAVVTDAEGKDHDFAATVLGPQGKPGFLEELRKVAKGNPKRVRLKGEFEVAQDGAYRLAINAAGKLRIDVRGETVFEGDALTFDRQAYTALTLKAGWHQIEIEYEPSSSGDLSIWLGGDVVSGPLQGKALRH